MNYLFQKFTWKPAVVFSVLFGVAFAVINYSGIGVSGLLDITNGANILDFEFGYDYEKAVAMLTALGSDGRSFYLTKIIPLDFIFPLTYMLFYSGWIILLLKHTDKLNRLKGLLLIPVSAMLFDWIENIGIIAILINFEYINSFAVFTASISGMLKRAFTIASITTIGILLIAFVFKRKK